MRKHIMTSYWCKFPTTYHLVTYQVVSEDIFPTITIFMALLSMPNNLRLG